MNLRRKIHGIITKMLLFYNKYSGRSTREGSIRHETAFFKNFGRSAAGHHGQQGNFVTVLDMPG